MYISLQYHKVYVRNERHQILDGRENVYFDIEILSRRREINNWGKTQFPCKIVLNSISPSPCRFELIRFCCMVCNMIVRCVSCTIRGTIGYSVSAFINMYGHSTKLYLYLYIKYFSEMEFYVWRITFRSFWIWRHFCSTSSCVLGMHSTNINV